MRTGALAPAARVTPAAPQPLLHREPARVVARQPGSDGRCVRLTRHPVGMTTADDLIYARSLDEVYDTRLAHARAVAAGREVRVARGVYLGAEDWQLLSDRARYELVVRAVATTRRNRPVLSHWSAAVIHGLPMLGPWPDSVHVTVGPTSGGRSRHRVVTHSLTLGDADVVEVDGMLVTSVARTVIDLAAVLSFAAGVVLADRALLIDRMGRSPTLASLDHLMDAWRARPRFAGSRRALRVVEFAVPASESPLESVSRVSMYVIGCPRPRLQTRYSDADGHIADVDFDWPEFDHIGEADGDAKYLEPSLRGGRSAERVVLDEKIREDRLRALPKSISRWRWEKGAVPDRLRAHLQRAGPPMGVPWR